MTEPLLRLGFVTVSDKECAVRIIMDNGPHETFLKKAITKDSNTKSYESLSTMNIIALGGQPSAAKEAKFKLAFLD